MINLDFITMATGGALSSGMGFLKPLYWVFGKAMEGLLFVFDNNYFLALVVFTIFTRLVLFPLNLRQQKTTAKTARLQPKIQKIQKKYANSKDPRDRQKMNEEMQELYRREGHNPMNMGCGPMLFQMLFLMGIIGIIYTPIQYVLGASQLGDKDVAQSVSDIIMPIYTSLTGEEKLTTNIQLNILQYFDSYKTALQTGLPDLFTDDLCNKIEVFRSNLTFAGLDMTIIPTFSADPIIIVPILSLVTSLASSIVSMLIQKKQNPASMGQQQQQMWLMMLMMPLFSFYIAFKVPAAVGFYWIISNVIAVLQQLVIAKFFPPRKNIANAMIESTIVRRSREESIKRIKG